MTEIVVASIGGSGSRLMAEMLSKATGRPRCNDEFEGDWRGHILHTHRPYHEEREKIGDDFRAVFMLGHIGDAICSFYEERIDIVVGMRLMGVCDGHIEGYVTRNKNNHEDAWLYIIDNDKLRWNKIISSWITAPNTIFVSYEMLCKKTSLVCDMIGEHVGYSVDAPEIRKRQSDWHRLPTRIKNRIYHTYPTWIKIGEAF